MARKIRIAFNDAWYHVMNRGAGRKHILNNTNNNKETFLEILSEVKQKYSIEIHAYCIMDNHYHLLIKTPLGNISQAMMHLQSVYTKIYNRKINSDGAIFRGRFKSILVNSDAYLLQVCRYIHLNPVEARLKEGINYKYSSFKSYIKHNKNNKLLSMNQISNIFHNMYSNSFYDFHIFDEDYKKLKSFYLNTSKNNFDVLEHSCFINKEPDNNYIILNKIENELLNFFKITGNELRKSHRGKVNIPKNIYVYIIRFIFDYEPPVISRYLGYTSSSTITKLIARNLFVINHEKTQSLKQYKNNINKLIDIVYQYIKNR